MPVFNDWSSSTGLIEQINRELQNLSMQANIFIVNDCSTTPPDFTGQSALPAVREVNVIHLLRNLGHQRAIAIGIAYLAENLPDPGIVVIMDSDGEDDATYIKAMLEKYHECNKTRVVFAERQKRSENQLLRAFYHVYRLVHYLLTGNRIRFGNYSLLDIKHIRSLSTSEELWTHYAAAVVSLRIPHVGIKTNKSQRIDGSSKMNFTNLVIHGLSAISVFGDKAFVRLLMLSLFFTLLVIFGFILQNLQSDFSNITGQTFTVLLLALSITSNLTCFSLLLLNSRKLSTFLPIRDYKVFVSEITTVSEYAG